jgi:hypothetical protein
MIMLKMMPKKAFFIPFYAAWLLGCANVEESADTGGSYYYNHETRAVIGSYTCSEVESDAEVYEIFQPGTTNCNFYCVKNDVRLSEADCYTEWKKGDTSLNYQFIAKSFSPLNAIHNDTQVYLYNFSPVDYTNVSLADDNGTFKSSISIKAWNRIKYTHAVTGSITVTIPTSDNAVMSKFANVKTQWKWAPHNYDPLQDHSNWWTNFTGEALRAYYIMNYNMAYYMSSDAFSNVITSNSITYAGANVQWYDATWTSYSANSDIVSRMRSIDAIFRIGVVHGGVASGLGGGDVHGVAPHVLYDVMRSSVWNNKGWNGSNVWLHEFAHCMGFSHSSNMTYAQEAPNDKNIPNLVQDQMILDYKNSTEYGVPLFPPGSGQSTIECKNNLAGLPCPSASKAAPGSPQAQPVDDFIQ